MTADAPMTKMVRKAGSEGSSSGMRCSATACAMTVAASRMAGRATGSSARRAGPESRSSRRAQSATSAAAAAAVNQRSATSIPRARPGSERTRNRLSVQLAQQLGSKKGPEEGSAERDDRGLQVDGATSARAAVPCSRPLG